MKDTKYYLSHPGMFINGAIRRVFRPILSDKSTLKLMYRYNMGEKLDLKHPVTFSQKLNWLKLYDRKPIYHQMVDKYDAKIFINNKLGEEYAVPTLGLWNSFEEIDWEMLPNEFVLKATHDCGSYYIVRDKSKIDKDACKKRLYRFWNQDYSKHCLEWQYTGLKSRIIAEPLIKDGSGECPTDYKIFTFNGEPKIFYITSGRGSAEGVREHFYNMEGQLLDISQDGFKGDPNKQPPFPTQLDKMIKISRILSENTYHLRVDFYEAYGKLYVGELTLCDGGGFHDFEPEHWNRTIGDWIHLPTDK